MNNGRELVVLDVICGFTWRVSRITIRIVDVIHLLAKTP